MITAGNQHVNTLIEFSPGNFHILDLYAAGGIVCDIDGNPLGVGPDYYAVVLVRHLECVVQFQVGLEVV